MKSSLRLPSLFKLFFPPPPPSEPLRLDVDGLSALLTRKPIRSLTLRLLPPHGELRVSAPLRASERSIRAFIAGRRDWILKHQQRMARTRAVAPPSYEDGTRLSVLGQALTLRLQPGRSTRARLVGSDLQLKAPATATRAQREAAVQRCLTRHLLAQAQALLPAREAALGVKATQLRLRRMRSRWGSCDTRKAVITLAFELVWREPKFLDYILLHELAHLRVRSHGPRFKAILDQHVPDWRKLRKELNQGGMSED